MNGQRPQGHIKIKVLYENNEVLVQKAVGLTENDILMALTSQDLIANYEFLSQNSQGLGESSSQFAKIERPK